MVRVRVGVVMSAHRRASNGASVLNFWFPDSKGRPFQPYTIACNKAHLSFGKIDERDEDGSWSGKM